MCIGDGDNTKKGVEKKMANQGPLSSVSKTRGDYGKYRKGGGVFDIS